MAKRALNDPAQLEMAKLNSLDIKALFSEYYARMKKATGTAPSSWAVLDAIAKDNGGYLGAEQVIAAGKDQGVDLSKTGEGADVNALIDIAETGLADQESRQTQQIPESVQQRETIPTGSLEGDVNGDGKVDILDSELTKNAADEAQTEEDMTALKDELWKVIRGEAPSAAEMQMREGMAQAQAGAQTASANAMGQGASAGMASYLASRNAQAAEMQTNQQTGQLRAQESALAAAQLGDLGQSEMQIQAQLKQFYIAQGYTNEQADEAVRVKMAEIAANQANVQASLKAGREQQDTANKYSLIGAGLGAGGMLLAGPVGGMLGAGVGSMFQNWWQNNKSAPVTGTTPSTSGFNTWDK